MAKSNGEVVQETIQSVLRRKNLLPILFAQVIKSESLRLHKLAELRPTRGATGEVFEAWAAGLIHQADVGEPVLQLQFSDVLHVRRQSFLYRIHSRLIETTVVLEVEIKPETGRTIEVLCSFELADLKARESQLMENLRLHLHDLSGVDIGWDTA